MSEFPTWRRRIRLPEGQTSNHQDTNNPQITQITQKGFLNLCNLRNLWILLNSLF